MKCKLFHKLSFQIIRKLVRLMFQPAYLCHFILSKYLLCWSYELIIIHRLPFSIIRTYLRLIFMNDRNTSFHKLSFLMAIPECLTDVLTITFNCFCKTWHSFQQKTFMNFASASESLYYSRCLLLEVESNANLRGSNYFSKRRETWH